MTYNWNPPDPTPPEDLQDNYPPDFCEICEEPITDDQTKVEVLEDVFVHEDDCHHVYNNIHAVRPNAYN